MNFKSEYMRRLELDRKVTEEMVSDGEITEEEGYFRNDIRRFEILEETEVFMNSIKECFNIMLSYQAIRAGGKCYDNISNCKGNSQERK